MAINNELYIGDVANPLLYFSSSTLRTVSGQKKVDLVGNELSIDLLDPLVEYQWYATQILKPTDADGLLTSDGYVLCGYFNLKPSDIPYGTPIWYFTGGVPAGKYYFKNAERVGPGQWLIHAVSVVGLLDVEMHRGGVYTGKDFASVLTEFFGGTVGESENGLTPIRGGIADCLATDALAVTTVHGLLPYASKRENLHQLIFDYCVNLTKSDTGDLIFSYLQPNLAPPYIPVDRIFMGGEVGYEEPVTDVELTEYTYVFDETAEPVKLYDNTTAPHTEGEALVHFRTPVKPDTIYTSEPTMIVRDANEVNAYVSGHGIIYGVPYQVQERVISRSVEGAVLRRTVSVDGLTLTNPLNSTNLMDVLFNYYTTRQVVSIALEVADEKPGELYRFIDSYGDEVTGFIQSMDWMTSGITRADCEIITNYTPTGISTNMQNVLLLTGSGEWEIPAAIRERENPYIRAVLIGGGQGGHGGYSGSVGDRRPDSPGMGGSSAPGGEGGRVLVVEIDVSQLVSINYKSGEGGEGGESDLPGQLGEDTVFGNYTTQAGAVVPGGILNIIDGQFYARSGAAGVAGAPGGKGATSAANSPTGEELASYGENGQSLTVKDKTWSGGKGGRTTTASQGGYFGWAFGGGGGGAAYGAEGGDGTDGRVEWQSVIGGYGGPGGTASIPGSDGRHVGNGGDAGHSGGGSGAPGSSGFSGGSAPVGYIYPGGKGSKGGRGADGGILIYY